MNLKISRDKNGNKTVVVSVPGFRGFSIQTNGNLPNTHRDGKPDKAEIVRWVKIYGTIHQKSLMEAMS